MLILLKSKNREMTHHIPGNDDTSEYRLLIRNNEGKKHWNNIFRVLKQTNKTVSPKFYILQKYLPRPNKDIFIK